MQLTSRPLILALALLWSGPGWGQVPTSTRDIVPSSSRPERSEIAQSDAVFRDLVACVIRYQPGRTRNLLDTIPGTHDEAAILYSFESRMESCFDVYRVGGRALVFQPYILRGVIAETYYRDEYPQGIGAAAAVPAETVAAWVRPRPADGEVTQSEMIHSMARCVTARRPAEVKAMMQTAPLGNEERAAMRALQADLSACLDANVSFNASRQSLRALLAEAALHYAEAQRHGWNRVGRPAQGRE